MSDQNGHRPEPNNTRIDKLEETLGYIEHDGTKLRDQIGELSKAVFTLTQRLDTLESRLVELRDQVGTEDRGLEPPPHSAGPDIPREPL